MQPFLPLAWAPMNARHAPASRRARWHACPRPSSDPSPRPAPPPRTFPVVAIWWKDTVDDQTVDQKLPEVNEGGFLPGKMYSLSSHRRGVLGRAVPTHPTGERAHGTAERATQQRLARFLSTLILKPEGQRKTELLFTGGKTQQQVFPTCAVWSRAFESLAI